MFWQGKIKIQKRKKIIVLIARGEAVRNFVYTDFLKVLSKSFSVTILTTISHDETHSKLSKYADEILTLKSFRERFWVILFREIIHTAHYRWIWTKAVKYYWGRHNERVIGDFKAYVRLKIWRIFSYIFSNRIMLKIGTLIDRWLTIKFMPTNEFEIIFEKLKPDIIFNCSHIHGVEADLPIRVANNLNIPTFVFLFSWDNLTSRGRIFPKYSRYYVWTEKIKEDLINIYKPEIKSNEVIVVGTPQFDFHFSNKHRWSKIRLYDEIGLDLNRPYILYTTGMSSDFPSENKIIESVIDFIKKIPRKERPQLVIRTYIKGTSQETIDLAYKMKDDVDIIFPSILWHKKYLMPLEYDCYVYTNLLRYCSLGINTASTVTLELMIHSKPTINISFEPPETNLPKWNRFSRHVDYEHYVPVAKSEAVIIAKSLLELFEGIEHALLNSNKWNIKQKSFLKSMFGSKIDGKSAKRIADNLTLG